CDSRRADVVERGRFEERLEDQVFVAPFDAHRGDIDTACFIERGEDRFDDHCRHSRATRSSSAAARRAVTGPGAPLGSDRSSAPARSRVSSTSSRAASWSAAASSSTAARVTPGKMPQLRGGVRSIEPLTRKMLLAVASERWPAVSRKRASSAPAARVWLSATMLSAYDSVLTPAVG